MSTYLYGVGGISSRRFQSFWELENVLFPKPGVSSALAEVNSIHTQILVHFPEKPQQRKKGYKWPLCVTGMRLHFVTISMFLELDRGFPIQELLGQVRTLGLLWVGLYLSIPEIPESSAQAPGPMILLRNLSLQLS